MPGRIGQQIGNYRLVSLLGSGGFADVYLGQHIYIHLLAAIKVLHTQSGLGDQPGFLQEAETIARLRHPHIIRILDFGIDRDNVPYLIMEYAPGGTLRQRHPKGSIVPLARVDEYISQIAQALQYAHDHKLIHRDLKPENLFVGNDGEILLSDFGIAAIAHGAASMKAVSYAGTIPYSAPEQILGKPGPASDQYSLGILSYEWLTGNWPFSGTMQEIISQHLGAAPSPLRERAPTIPPTLETVIMKSLIKEPIQRFESIQAFATAFNKACNPSSSLMIPVMPVAEKISSQREPAQMVGANYHSTRRKALLLGLAGIGLATTGIAGWGELTHRFPANTKNFSLKPGTNLYIYRRHADKVLSVAWSPDGTSVASGSGDRTVQVWNATTGNLYSTYRGHISSIFSVAWSHDSKYIASGSGDRTVQVWNATTGNLHLTYHGHKDWVTSVAWSPNGKSVASGSGDRTVQIWDVTTGTSHLTYHGHTNWWSTSVAWSSNGIYIASGEGATVEVWDATTGVLHLIYPGHADWVFFVAWSPDSRYIASGGKDATIEVWDATTGNYVVGYSGHIGDVTSVAWSPDGKHIASGGSDKTIQIWDAMTGTPRLTCRGHTDTVMSVAWSPDGKYIASGSNDKTIQIWTAL